MIALEARPDRRGRWQDRVEGLSFDLRPGDKVGVVGRNGAGKTSSMKVLTGEVEPAGGSVLRRGSVGYLRQDPRQHRAEDDDLALEHILAARGLVELSRSVEKARIALAESHDERSIRRFSRLEEEYTLLGGYQAESEAKTIVAGLGLPQERLALPVKTLSGGERRRLELAKILFGGSDLLLLDEPTNHLDVDAKTWLMRFLGAYKGALMVISHDLGLLDASITRIRTSIATASSSAKAPIGTGHRSRRAATKVSARRGRDQAPQALADQMRGQTVRRARVAKSLDSRRSKLESVKVEVRRTRSDCGSDSPSRRIAGAPC
jgi:ATPase subunit of ABC transporter with duplicated ATPase domains